MYTKFQQHLQKELADIEAAGLYKRERIIESPQGAEILVKGKKCLNFCANNYLGLADNPELIEAAKKGMDARGYGMASVRFICGCQDLHKQLEKKIAEFFGTEDTILYAACFDANGGVFEPLLTEEDAIISDALNHASIIDGVRLCKAQRYRYANADMADLEEQLKAAQKNRFRIIVTDGVFSMEGDVCKLPDIVDLAHKYNANIMVDEAHGIGVFGEGGRGVCDHFGLRDEVDLIMGTFSKSFASLGGFIATDKIITNYLRHHSRSYIFTASITPASTAAAMKAIDLLIAEPERQEHLWALTHEALQGFREMGCEIGHTETPIIPLFIRDNNKTFAITRDLLNEGIFVNPVVSPAVAPNDTLIRFSLMATHTHEQVAIALEKIQKVFRSYGLVP